MELIVDQWYRDPEMDAYFKVLAVAPGTVDVVDRWGNRRTVNRMLFEKEMLPTKRVPALPKGSDHGQG